jgi:hypothetical protein
MAEAVEIHLEDAGQRSWPRALLSTLTGSLGSAQFHFVARAARPDAATGTDASVDAEEQPVASGATFPLLRAQDLDDRSGPNAWVEDAERSLAELVSDLESSGWSRAPGRGRHWWSVRLTRANHPAGQR